MNFVNRISLIITPKEPMYQWIKSIAPDEAPSFEELTNESSCYLLDEPTQDHAIEELLSQLIAQHYPTIWRNELSVWDEYLDNVPSDMSQLNFKLWFNISLSGLTFDLAKAPLLTANVE